MLTKTGYFALSAALFGLTASAHAGDPGSYTLTPVSTGDIQPVYVQPAPAYAQPTPAPSEPQIGEIIYNTEPLQPTTTTYGTVDQGTTTYTLDTQTYGTAPTSNDRSENGSYVSSPIVGKDTGTTN